jgi:hypothetical protein
MIEDSRALTESDRIAAFRELLSTMTRALDVREVFQSTRTVVENGPQGTRKKFVKK